MCEKELANYSIDKIIIYKKSQHRDLVTETSNTIDVECEDFRNFIIKIEFIMKFDMGRLLVQIKGLQRNLLMNSKSL